MCSVRDAVARTVLLEGAETQSATGDLHLQNSRYPPRTRRCRSVALTCRATRRSLGTANAASPRAPGQPELEVLRRRVLRRTRTLSLALHFRILTNLSLPK